MLLVRFNFAIRSESKESRERERETVTSPERTSKEREACTVPRSAGRSVNEGMHKKCLIAHDFAYLKEKIRQRKHTEWNRSRSGMSEQSTE